MTAATRGLVALAVTVWSFALVLVFGLALVQPYRFDLFVAFAGLSAVGVVSVAYWGIDR